MNSPEWALAKNKGQMQKENSTYMCVYLPEKKGTRKLAFHLWNKKALKISELESLPVSLEFLWPSSQQQAFRLCQETGNSGNLLLVRSANNNNIKAMD